MSLKLDHIIYAVPDLNEGMENIERLLGYMPVYGGRHPNKGSHNALLALGEDVYLEIIAPDPNQPDPLSPRSFGLDTLTEPRLVTWAARTDDMVAIVAQARASGYDPGERVAGGRTCTDGVRLFWESTKRPEALQGLPPLGDWLIPFLIDWGSTPHPAAAQQNHCQFISLQATHPDPTLVQTILHALAIEDLLHVERGEAAALQAVIEGKNGRVILH